MIGKIKQIKHYFQYFFKLNIYSNFPSFITSEYKLKTLREADINLVDFDEAKIRANLKDREHGKDYIKDGMCV